MAILGTQEFEKYMSLEEFVSRHDLEDECKNLYDSTDAGEIIETHGIDEPEVISDLIAQNWDGDYIVNFASGGREIEVKKVKYRPEPEHLPEPLQALNFLSSNEADITAKRNNDYCSVWNLKDWPNFIYMIQYIEEDERNIIGSMKEGTVEAEEKRLQKDGFEIVGKK